jgi:hypothetical protein
LPIAMGDIIVRGIDRVDPFQSVSPLAARSPSE